MPTFKREGWEKKAVKLLYNKPILTLWRKSHYFNHIKMALTITAMAAAEVLPSHSSGKVDSGLVTLLKLSTK